MKPLYSSELFNSSNVRDNLPLECEHCQAVFSVTKRTICKVINNNLTNERLKYCSKKCKREVSINSIKLIKINCTHCNSLIIRRLSTFNACKRKGVKHSFCNAKCRNHWVKNDRREKSNIIKICPECKSQHYKYNSKFCSKECYINNKQPTKEKIIASYEFKIANNIKVFGKDIRRYLFSIKPYECEICKHSEWLNNPINLTVHHKDGNADHNDVSNLQLLCWNCHSATDNYGRKNKSSTRSYRKKYTSLQLS